MHLVHSHDRSSPDAPAPSAPDAGVTDRAELIERIKAGQTPTWIPNRSLSNHYPNITPSQQLFDEHPDRPKSALHQGVFTNESRTPHNLPPSPTFPPPSPFTPSSRPSFSFNPHAHELFQARTRQRAPSISSFVQYPPTSPLVFSSNTDNLGNSESELSSPTSTDPIDISSNPVGAFRPPSSLARRQTVDFALSAHRSISENWYEHPSPSIRQARRLSGFGNYTSDLPFGSFVGSYEESILNGRMSTTPSKPLNFVAQIGVLGIGKCKPALRCPAHVTIPFPAYFYSVVDYDSPSPYVGQVDLDTALGSENGKPSKRPSGVGGSYRIPQRGQLQIVIKNPNKTAVKLFLIPYDLRDMEAGTKTFIRQKSYSVGNTLLSDIPTNTAMKKEKDALRYLIHLQICCPSRGRYYLHKSIRLVFANRVPDGKEKLRNEILWQEPKFSPWKQESGLSSPSSSMGNRRRSASMYGTAGGSRAGTPPPPLPLFKKTDLGGGPIGAVLEGDNEVDYEKMSISPTTLGRGDGQGLLARKLKSLEVVTGRNGT